MDKQAKLISLTAQILGQLFENGSITAVEIIDKHDQIFNKTSSDEEKEQLIEYFIGIMRNNSLLTFNSENRCFYFKSNKL